MNENPNQNRRTPAEPGASGNFKLDIDERDLATGSFDQPQTGRGRGGSYVGQPYSNTAYYASDKERKAEQKAHKKRDKLKARKNKRVFSLVWLCMVLLVSFALASYLIGGANDFFAVGRTAGSTEIELPATIDADGLAKLLYQRGAIKKPDFFALYSKITVDDWKYFEPGVYKVETNLDYEDLINQLQGGNQTREEVTVTFPEGMNVLEMAQLLDENDVCSQDDFLTALNTGDFTNYADIAAMGDASGKYYKLEGYLFPDTYNFYKGEEIESVIGKMINNFKEKMNDDMRLKLQQSGMTMDQIVTLASIVQGEAASASDMYKVSAVLHNRLSFGAEYGIYRLECDSTSCYPYKNPQAVPETGALSYGNYDTYQIEGLPAGAICNPGLDALKAALEPSTEEGASSYLYFCHAADGTAYYASTSWEHEENKVLAGLSDGSGGEYDEGDDDWE